MMRTMKIIKRIFNFSVMDEKNTIDQVFNNRDLIWISDIRRNRDSPNSCDYYFIIKYSKDLSFKFIQEGSTKKDPVQLIELRQLFINTIGHSYLSLTKGDTKEIIIRTL
jgi:hypothetical protein